jgi:hypothetical protein
MKNPIEPAGKYLSSLCEALRQHANQLTTPRFVIPNPVLVTIEVFIVVLLIQNQKYYNILARKMTSCTSIYDSGHKENK